MKYKLLGNSGLRVSEICLGAMTFGLSWGFGAAKAESRKVFDIFASGGGNFIDTADCYTDGDSEKYVGEFIRGNREHFVLATKYSVSTAKGEVNACGNSRKNMKESVEASLKRLKVDYIDLYWVHAWDFMTPVEEIMRALDDLTRQGKILYVGISDAPAWVIAQANTYAKQRALTPFVAMQIEYSLIERTPEHELLPMARSFDIAIMPWKALGGGLLTGKYHKVGKETQVTDSKRFDRNEFRLIERNMAIAGEVVTIARELNARPAQVALRWLMMQKGVVLPIVGARTPDQMKENMGVLDVVLSPEHLERLNRKSFIDPIFPMRFLNNNRIREGVYGGTHDCVDNHRKNS